MKKLKLFWSYQLDKTEEWLSQMARKGYLLNDFNHFTRVFSFIEGPCVNVTYAIQIEKAELSNGLTNSGWHVAASSGKWQVLKNEETAITVFPSRDEIVKRTRLHAYLFLLITFLYLSLQMPVIIILGLAINIASDQFVIAPILIPILIFLLFTALMVFVFHAYRKFEKKEMDLEVERIRVGRKIRKIRPGWMYVPLQTKEWLEELARQGLELESVYATVFTFRETGAKNIIYEVSFEPRVNTNFFTIHKEIGWKLKYASNITWLNYSIWAMPCNNFEEVPAFTYDLKEKKRQVKKAFMMNAGMGTFILLLSCQSLYVNIIAIPDPFFEWSFMGVVRILLIVCIIMWIILYAKIIAGFRKEIKMLKASQL